MFEMIFIFSSILILFISPAYSYSNDPSIINKNVTTSIIANDGDSVQFECYSTKSTPTRITWYKASYDSNRTLPNGEITYEGNVLKFPSVTPQSSGAYVCNVTDDHSYAIQVYTLLIKSKPQITQTSRQYKPDSSIELQCTALCIPKSTFKWYKSGSLFSVPDRDEVDSGSPINPWGSNVVSSTIIISTVNNDYKGLYTCIIENEFGKDEKDFDIYSIS